MQPVPIQKYMIGDGLVKLRLIATTVEDDCRCYRGVGVLCNKYICICNVMGVLLIY